MGQTGKEMEELHRSVGMAENDEDPKPCHARVRFGQGGIEPHVEEARWRSHWRHDPRVRRPKLRGKRCHKSHHGLWKCCLSQGPKWRKVRLRCHELGSKVITAHGGNAGAKFTSRWEAISRGKGHNGKKNARIMHCATTRTYATRARANTSTHEVSPPNVTVVTTVLDKPPGDTPITLPRSGGQELMKLFACFLRIATRWESVSSTHFREPRGGKETV